MKNLLSQFWNNEDGITAIEYAMLGVAMAVGLVAIMGSAGTADATGKVTGEKGFLGSLTKAFSTIASKISGAGS